MGFKFCQSSSHVHKHKQEKTSFKTTSLTIQTPWKSHPFIPKPQPTLFYHAKPVLMSLSFKGVAVQEVKPFGVVKQVSKHSKNTQMSHVSERENPSPCLQAMTMKILVLLPPKLHVKERERASHVGGGDFAREGEVSWWKRLEPQNHCFCPKVITFFREVILRNWTVRMWGRESSSYSQSLSMIQWLNHRGSWFY